MPVKQQRHAEVNNFSGGYITEATDLNFPQNSFSDVSNFVIKRDGSIARRLGMDLEKNSTIIDSNEPKSTTFDSISTYRWKEVGGSIEREFLVVQVGKRLLFFDALVNNMINAKVGQLTLSEALQGVKFSFASAEGLLVVVSGASPIILVSYNPNNGSFSYSLGRLTTRDVWGMQETESNYETDPNYRGGINYSHEYNLRNQSWALTRRVKNVSNTKDPIVQFYDNIGKYPSNSAQVWTGISTTVDSAGATPYESFSGKSYLSKEGYDPIAPKGFFIIDVLNRGTSRGTAMTKNRNNNPGLEFSYSTHSYPTDQTQGGPTAVAEFAGRIFYGGFTGEVSGGDARSPNYTNYIFFSKLITKKSEITECFQEGDPTSRDNPDIVDTDGGFLRISEAKNIVSMFPIGGGLCVLSTNGVWLITGESDYGFSATNYKSTKLSEVGISSPKSIIREGSSAYFWADDSIYVMAKDQFGDYRVESITLSTIQTFYDDIPTSAKQQAVGVYDSTTKTIRWLFTRGAGLGSEELVFDISLKCFYKNKIEAPEGIELEVVSAFNTPPFSQLAATETVIVGADAVQVNSDAVITNIIESEETEQDAKYLLAIKDTSANLKIGVATFNNKSFMDFVALDGTGHDAYSFAITGTATMGDSSVDKQVPYLTMHFERTENAVDANGNLYPASSCLIRGQWSFASGVQSNKWSMQQQAYRFRRPIYPGNLNSAWDNGFSIVSTKNKIRGEGPAISLRIDTEPTKDCRLLGWSIAVTGSSIA